MAGEKPRRESEITTGQLALAGIAAPLLFVGSVIGQSLARPDYSSVSQMVSELAAYPGGWIQSATFYATGALMAAFGLGLNRGVRPGAGGLAGPVLIIVSGFGLMAAGYFPVRFDNGALVEPPGHIIGSLTGFWGAAIGYIVLSRRMAADPAWRDHAAVALTTGIAIIALFFVFVGLGMPENGPLHAWLGATQRALIASWLVGVLILALRLRKVAAPG